MTFAVVKAEEFGFDAALLKPNSPRMVFIGTLSE
jgi:hypothetical protein